MRRGQWTAMMTADHADENPLSDDRRSIRVSPRSSASSAVTVRSRVATSAVARIGRIRGSSLCGIDSARVPTEFATGSTPTIVSPDLVHTGPVGVEHELPS
jgi:hypothetical protein